MVAAACCLAHSSSTTTAGLQLEVKDHGNSGHREILEKCEEYCDEPADEKHPGMSKTMVRTLTVPRTRTRTRTLRWPPRHGSTRFLLNTRNHANPVMVPVMVPAMVQAVISVVVYGQCTCAYSLHIHCLCST